MENAIKFLTSHFDTIITVCVTVLGFIITYLMTRKNFKDEVKKNKLALNTENIKSLPYDICQLMHHMTQNNSDNILNIVNEMREIFNKVIAYGSSKAISIAVHMQSLNYKGVNSQEEKFELMVTYSLLITQIKFDLSSEIISPESYFEITLNDYGNGDTRKICKKLINKVVEELDLYKKFKVDE